MRGPTARPRVVQEAGARQSASVRVSPHRRAMDERALIERANRVCQYGYPALIAAILTGDEREMHYLINCGADVNATSASGRTALHTACSRGNIAAVVALLAEGADLETRSLAGKTALQAAAAKGHWEAARLLLDAGAIGDQLPPPAAALPTAVGSSRPRPRGGRRPRRVQRRRGGHGGAGRGGAAVD